jgi:hypothetical protein
MLFIWPGRLSRGDKPDLHTAEIAEVGEKRLPVARVASAKCIATGPRGRAIADAKKD